MMRRSDNQRSTRRLSRALWFTVLATACGCGPADGSTPFDSAAPGATEVEVGERPRTGPSGAGESPREGGAPRDDAGPLPGPADTGSPDAGPSSPPCEDEPPPPGEYTCEQQVGWGKCDEPWMSGYCLKSCHRCAPPPPEPPAGNCAAPVSPGASPEAKRLLCYVYELYGKRVLSGQQETSWAADLEGDMKYIEQHTGKLPAIRGLDFLYKNGTTDRAIAWWRAGGIPMICHHMGAPTLSDTYDDSKKAVPGGIDRMLTAGTDTHRSFMERLDYAAGELKRLQDAHVPVLWRPWHEAEGRWFWWSMEGGAQYVKLWRFTFDYLTKTKGLKNLLWMHPFASKPDGAYWPGKDSVDVGAADIYSDGEQPYGRLFGQTAAIVGGSLPIALHENGRLPDPARMFGAGEPRWVTFNTWADPFPRENNTVEHMKAVYAHPVVVTRDEVPNLK